MSHKTEKQLNSIRSVDGFQCLVVCFAQVLTPRGIAEAQNECYCKSQGGIRAAPSESYLEAWPAVRLRKTN